MLFFRKMCKMIIVVVQQYNRLKVYGLPVALVVAVGGHP